MNCQSLYDMNIININMSTVTILIRDLFFVPTFFFISPRVGFTLGNDLEKISDALLESLDCLQVG